MAAIVQTAQDKAGISLNAVEVKGVTNNVFMVQFGSIHIGMGKGLPNGEILFVAQASQTRTATGVTGGGAGNILNGVEAGSLFLNQTVDGDEGQWYYCDGGTSLTSTDWTEVSTAAT